MPVGGYIGISKRGIELNDKAVIVKFAITALYGIMVLSMKGSERNL